MFSRLDIAKKRFRDRVKEITRNAAPKKKKKRESKMKEKFWETLRQKEKRKHGQMQYVKKEC